MALKTWTEIAERYANDGVRRRIAAALWEEKPDAFRDDGCELFEDSRILSFIEAKMPALKRHPSVLIPSTTASEDQGALYAAGVARVAADRGIEASAVIAFTSTFPDEEAEGTPAWWHVRYACRMFGADFPADSYLYSRSAHQMRAAGHRQLS